MKRLLLTLLLCLVPMVAHAEILGHDGYVSRNPPDTGLPFYLVSLNDFPSTFWSNVQTDGDDIRASDEEGNELAVHRIWFTDNGTSGVGFIAVARPGHVTSATRIRVWCGDAAASLPPPTAPFGQHAVYRPSIKGFYPAGLGNDATSFANHLATVVGSPTVGGVAGPIAGSFATDLNASQYASVATANKPTGALATLLASVYPDIDGNMTALCVADTLSTNDYFDLCIAGSQPSDPVRFTARRSTQAHADKTSFTVGAWQNIAGLCESVTSRYAFLNGVAGTQETTSNSPSNLDVMAVGTLLRNTAANGWDGRIGFALFDADAWTAAEIDLWHDMLADQEAFYGGAPTWTASSKPAPAAMPEFELLGAKVTETSLGAAMAFPRLFDNDAHRAMLPNLPATKYSVLFCTDHAASTGILWRADFDDIEGAWTITQVYTHANQREMYALSYDAANNRIILQCHDNNSNGQTYNTQHAVLLSTTNLSSFTEIDADLYPYGGHTGYGKQLYDAARGWAFSHLLIGGENSWWGFSYAGSNLQPSLAGFMTNSPSHLLGFNRACYGSSSLTQFDDGEWYMLDWVTRRGRLDAEANKEYIAAFPMFWRWDAVPQYRGGHYRLISKGSDPADLDYAPLEAPEACEVDGELYLMVASRDNAGENRILLYKATETPAEWVPAITTVEGNGRLRNPGPETVVFDWDAANDAVPDDITITAESGSNASSQSAGNYYELGTGSGSAQQLTANIDTLVDPTAHEVVELTVSDWRMKPAAVSTEACQVAIIDNWTTARDGVLLGTTSTYRGTGVYPYKNNVAANAHDSYVASLFDLNANLAGYTRTFGVDLTLRTSNYGTQLTILLDGQVAYFRNLTMDNLAWNASTFAGLNVTTDTAANYMRFSRLKLSTFDYEEITNPGVGSAFLGN